MSLDENIQSVAAQTFKTGDGCTISFRYISSAGKPVLVFSNSLGTNMSMWDAQVEVLSERFNILCYDTRGHGESDAPEGNYSIDRLGNDLVELVDHLELETFFFCGLSLGGMVGQWLTYRHPGRLKGLVLANTSAFIGPYSAWQERINSALGQGMRPLWQSVLPRWFSTDFIERNPDVINSMKTIFMQTSPTGYSGCCGAIRDMDQRSTSILNRLRTLVIAGSEDLATPIEQSEYLVECADDARLVVLEAGHLSNIEQSSAFNSALSEFL